MKSSHGFLVLTISTLLSVSLCYKLAESFYFDKLFYQKSSAHGYKAKLPTENIHNDVHNYYRLFDFNYILPHPSQEKRKERLRSSNNSYRVLIIGDSMTFGLGVRYDYTYSHVLETRLNSQSPTEVFTLAYPGDDILDHYTKLKLAEEVIKPDLVIIMIVENDLTFSGNERYPQKNNYYHEIKKQCQKPDLIPIWSSISDEESQLKQITIPSFSEDYSGICFLRQISWKLDPQKVMIMPALDFTKDSEADKLMDIYIFELQIAGLYVIDLASHSDFSYVRISEKEGHPSRATHKAYAKVLFDEITKNPRWKFGEKHIYN